MDPSGLPKIMINWKPEGKAFLEEPGKMGYIYIYIYTTMSERDLRMGKWNNRRQWNMKV
jgi:hypothetical protein